MSNLADIPSELNALRTFFNLATQQSHGAAHVAAQVLLGLYNGERFPFNLAELRRLDASHLDMALALLRFDASPRKEVHEWLNTLYGRTDFGMRFEHIAHNWRMKGRCKKAYLDPVPRITLS